MKGVYRLAIVLRARRKRHIGVFVYRGKPAHPLDLEFIEVMAMGRCHQQDPSGASGSSDRAKRVVARPLNY